MDLMAVDAIFRRNNHLKITWGDVWIPAWFQYKPFLYKTVIIKSDSKWGIFLQKLQTVGEPSEFGKPRYGSKF